MYHGRTSLEKGLLTIHLSGWWCSWNAPWFLTDIEGSHSSSSGQGFPPPLTDQRHQTWQVAALSYRCLSFLLPGLQLCNTEGEIITYHLIHELQQSPGSDSSKWEVPTSSFSAENGFPWQSALWLVLTGLWLLPLLRTTNLCSKLPRGSWEPAPLCRSSGALRTKVMGMVGSSFWCWVWRSVERTAHTGEKGCGWGDWILLPQAWSFKLNPGNCLWPFQTLTCAKSGQGQSLLCHSDPHIRVTTHSAGDSLVAFPKPWTVVPWELNTATKLASQRLQICPLQQPTEGRLIPSLTCVGSAVFWRKSEVTSQDQTPSVMLLCFLSMAPHPPEEKKSQEISWTQMHL